MSELLLSREEIRELLVFQDEHTDACAEVRDLLLKAAIKTSGHLSNSVIVLFTFGIDALSSM
jgi:hypothetical protein